MPLAKRLKLSLSQEIVHGGGDENGSSAPVLIKLEPVDVNEESTRAENENVSVSTNQVFIKSENEPDLASLSKETISFPNDGSSLFDLEKESCRRARSKSVGEAVVEFKPVRISERLSIKRNRLGDTEDGDIQALPPPPAEPKKQKSANTSNVSKQQKKATSSVAAAAARTKLPKGGKKRKPWISWSIQEQKIFFMYLGMYGKNFDAITKKMARIKGCTEKDKMQVRYFYYRCWAKVCKVIRMHQKDVGVKTVDQELYCLINYGALRKEMKESDPQFSDCLYELIGHGETTYSFRGGKNKRSGKVKTPVCTYLKNLLKIEKDKRMPDSSTTCKLPPHVTLELTPKNSAAWAKVQELSQNPRVRFKLSNNRTLESVFKYLSSKWKSHGARLRESLGDIKEDFSEDLVFHLHPSCKVKPFTMKPVDSKRMDTVFKNYMEKILPELMKTNGQNNELDQTDGYPTSENCGEEEKGIKKEGTDEVKSQVLKTEVASQSNGEGLNGLDNASQNDPVSLKNSSDVPANNKVTVSVCNSEFTDVKKEEALDNTEPNSVLDTKVTETDSVSSSSWSSLSLSSAASSILSISSSAESHSTQISTNECIPLSPNSKTPPLSPPVPIPSNVISSPLRSLAAALQLKPVSSFPVTFSSSMTSSSSSVVSLSSSSPTSTCQVSTNPVPSFLPPLLSPSSKKKKTSKTCNKKCTNPSICDNDSTNTLLSIKEDSNSTSPSSKVEPVRELTEEVEKEMTRLHTLADSGFSMANSNTVTLLHLSLLLGRASVIRLEYEWIEKPNSNSQMPPAFCAVSDQVTNVLRRLCHIAALELAGFKLNNKQSMNSKGINKSESAESGNKKEELSKASNGRNKKREGVRSVATMTDFRMTIPAKAIPFAPAKLIRHAAPEIGSTPTIQLHGTDSVFRVPLVPTFRPMLSKEQEEKLKMQQEQAKAIMREQHAPRSRLLKRRSIPSRKGKQPPIIVQRTLLPKPGGTPMVVSMSPQVPTIPPLIQAPNTSALQLALNSSTTTTWVGGSQPSGMAVLAGTNILELAVKSAQIGLSPTKDDSVSSMTDLLDGESSLSSSQIISPPSAPPTIIVSKEPSQSSISDHADISISDFDLSLASASISSVGPDAGDKFLDSVLERSQGFSGLITPVSKDSSSQHPPIHVYTSSLSVFNISGMKTPPHTSSHSSSTSPDKLTHPDQSWMAGESADVSLSSILGEFSSFQRGKPPPQLKTPCKTTMSNSVLFDQSSSDAVDHLVTVSIPKPSFVNDVSLNLLLGDPSLSSPVPRIKEEDGQHQPYCSESMTSLLAPTPALFSEASQDSLAKLDVDVTLQGMVNDSSVDLVTKFEKLAAQMAENRQDQEASRLNTPVKQEQGIDVVKDNTAA